METQIRMPRASETMEVGKVVQWLKENGAQVRRGEAIAEIETDKTTLLLEARATGILAITAEAGVELPVEATLGSIESV
jgi:pyruvate/2-oxoglutarate dehydrogenase complex dihydrolipoamide acyltransferase (E2) component